MKYWKISDKMYIDIDHLKIEALNLLHTTNELFLLVWYN